MSSYPQQAFCPSISISLRAPAFGTQKIKDSLLSFPFHNVTLFLWGNWAQTGLIGMWAGEVRRSHGWWGIEVQGEARANIWEEASCHCSMWLCSPWWFSETLALSFILSVLNLQSLFFLWLVWFFMWLMHCMQLFLSVLPVWLDSSLISNFLQSLSAVLRQWIPKKCWLTKSQRCRHGCNHLS